METAVIVLAVVAAVLAIALIVTGAKLSAMRKLHSSEKAEDVYVKGGVRVITEKLYEYLKTCEGLDISPVAKFLA